MDTPDMLEAKAKMLEECERTWISTALVCTRFKTYVNVLLSHGVPPNAVAWRVAERIALDEFDALLIAKFSK